MEPANFHRKAYYHPGILNPEGYAREVQLECYKPSAALAPFVELYFIARWSRPGRPDFVATDILTRPVTNVFFTQEGTFFNGVTHGVRSFRIGQSGAYAGVKFRPGGFRPFYKQSLATITSQSQPAATVFPAASTTFSRQLLHSADDQYIVSQLEHLLAATLPPSDSKIALIQELIAAIETSDFPYTAQSLARDFAINPRTLQHLFKDYVGVSVKWTIMRNRLLHSVQHATDSQRPNWTRLAADLNYATQSHFTNDFKRIIGITPTEYLKVIFSKSDTLPVSTITVVA